MIMEFCGLFVPVLNPDFISFFENELQSLSRMRMCTRCREQHGKFCAILHNVYMDIIAWVAHEATGNCVDAIIRHSKYSCRRLIDSAFIGQYSVIFYNPLTANCCIFRQKYCERNSRSFDSLQI